MPVRLAACDPCRISKVSCDHAVPCGRCRESANDSSCTYRPRPFKRRRLQQETSLQTRTDYQNRTDLELSTDRLLPSEIRANVPKIGSAASTNSFPLNAYPNPGYQGISSHTSIFDQVKATGGAGNSLISTVLSDESNGTLEDYEISRHVKLLEEIALLDIKASIELVRHWISSGINLALAGILVIPCSMAIAQLFDTMSGDELATALFSSSRERPTHEKATPISTFVDSCCNRPSWATLGMFLVALSRAIDDTALFSLLYSTRTGQQKLQKMALHQADQCLEICLSLDCLNDIQLLLQYENFIAHSMIDGDQSYHSWRRLGDVISSLYALGYHERVDLTALASNTLESLRCAAFCRAYSADKNVSIFLGRPPRMHQKHTSLKLSAEAIPLLFGDTSSTDVFEYMLETRWTVACAVLKERVLDLAGLENQTIRLDVSSTILQDCEALQAALPRRFYLSDHLKNFQGSYIERDFVASAALNLLHVRFLLQSSSMQGDFTPSSELIKASATMLKLVAEVAILKATLVNSGTGFIWKIVFYGLPAAGIVCLALVSQGVHNWQTNFPVAQSLRDLNVLVAHVEAGVLICPEQPNYALLQAAMGTIKSVIERLTLGLLPVNIQDDNQASIWMPWDGQGDSLDFELDFWTNLAEHPALFRERSSSLGDDSCFRV